MSARSPSASKGAAAAAASANAAVTSAASASAQLSPSHAGSNQRIVAAASAGKRHAGSAKQQASPSASIASGAAVPSSTSSRKRAPAAAAAADDVTSAAVDASSSAAHSSDRDQAASSLSQSKKQRGGSNKGRGSSAAAASSVGIDSIRAPSRRSASTAAASSASARSLVRQDECSGQEASDDSDEVEEDNAQERKPAAVAAAASKPRPPLPRAPQPHRLFVDAQELLRGALPFAEAQFAGVSEVIDARASLHGPASAMTLAAVTSLCFVLLWPSYYPQRSPEQHVLRDWFLSVDQLWTQLASSLPHMHLSWQDCDELLGEAICAGALQVVLPLIRRFECAPSQLSIGANPLITHYCIRPREHVVSLQPYLRLFEFGLDPTEVDEGGETLSAVQLARSFVRGHAPPAVPRLNGLLASMQAAVDAVKSLPMPSVVHDRAIQHRKSDADEEDERRTALHAQFMHALIPTWLAHSTKVRSLLLAAAPTRLIPPLVDVVALFGLGGNAAGEIGACRGVG